ncbi:MAG TPA: hypothetical protein ENK02_06065 [Planctomycetes bacterium]|nr:hypothetical protein [Planctomycetota bacterium]
MKPCPPLYDIASLPAPEVEELFYFHAPLLADLLEDLERETARSRAQHHLLIGGEGAGKSTLLARLRGALLDTYARRGNKRNKHKAKGGHPLFPIYLSPTALTLGRLSQLWLRVGGALPIDFHPPGGTEQEENEEQLLRELPARILEACSEAGLRPVLLLEDFDLFLGRVARQERSLRALLLQPGAPILVASASRAGSQDYQAAFFDHFKTHYLPAPNVQQARGLLLHFAEVLERPRLAKSPGLSEGRCAALQVFTGGNPRSLTRLWKLYAQGRPTRIEEDLAYLLDEETPVHGALLDSLSEQARVVLVSMAAHWSPIALGTLAKACSLPKGSVSSQLDRLRKAGLVHLRSLPGTRRKGYEIAHRRLALWLLAQDSTTDGRTRLFALARFLESFLPAQQSWADPGGTPMLRGALPRELGRLATLLSEKNWGQAAEELPPLLTQLPDLPGRSLGAWLALFRAGLAAGFGGELLDLVENSREAAALFPWVEALRARLHQNPSLLLALPHELRPSAQWLYEALEQPKEES